MTRAEPHPPKALRLLLSPLTLLERSRGRRRLALVAAYTLVVAAVVALAWRESRLVGVPDVGDPFDAAPLRALRVPEDRNAFTLYHRASLQLKKNLDIERRICNTPYVWPSDSPALAYLAANEEADALWRRGAERPDAMVHTIDDMTIETGLLDLQDARGFARHAMLRASRCRDLGDLAGAWGWYRAILRSSRHAGRHAPIIGRLVGTAMYSAGRAAIAGWAADDRVDAAMLREALADVHEAEALRTSEAESVRIEYISTMASLKDPAWVSRFLAEDPWSQGEVDRTDWRNHLPIVQKARWFLANEPERSRRVMKLAFANWLEHVDDPASTRPPLVGTKAHPRVVFDSPSAAFLDPSELAREFESCLLAKSLGVDFVGAMVRSMDRDRAAHAGLVVDLTRHLYAREHDGLMPESDALLVGPYLDRWPAALPPPEPASKGP